MTPIEGMGGLILNTHTDFVIACAGVGSRMHEINKLLHKGLLSYQSKPIIYHLINQIPTSFRLVFLVGHLSQQIRDFVELSFPERQVVFVEVEDYTSADSGTAKSLKQASYLLSKSFWYAPCDAFFGPELTELLSEKFENSVYFGANTNLVSDLDQYCLFAQRNGRITGIYYKSDKHSGLPVDETLVFTGLMFIYDKVGYFQGLANVRPREFVHAIPLGANVKEVSLWKDFGTPVEYLKNIREDQVFDFSKPNEVTYLADRKVIKWWSDLSIPSKKLEKPKAKPAAYPRGLVHKGQFLMYEKVEGDVLYSMLTPQLFNTFLDWLSESFWGKNDVDISKSLVSFYVDKSKLRIELIKQHLPYVFEEVFYDTFGNKIIPSEVLEGFSWNLLNQDVVVSNIHGDLQFDNVIVTDQQEFCLIDWRSEFGNELVLGDIYYDLAKLYGGMLIDYSRIKRGEFSFNLKEGVYAFSFHSCPNFEEITSIFRAFIESQSLSWRKTVLLTSLIFLNMCPLHERPFSDILFFKSLEMMRNYSNDV
jgi:CTP:phosphocholine cytidylyltransferase-like protein